MSNFWKDLSKPFFVLAPMEDVTDVVFREVTAVELPKPDVFFTEFTNVDGLFSQGQENTIYRLKYTENQRPIVAQIWGTNPENFYKAAKLVKEMKFDGIDINMGCPVREVIKKGAGAALCTNLPLTREIISQVKLGADGIAVSVKTRLGLKKVITDELISFLLQQKINALTIHGRTASQMSNGEADWEEIGKAVKLKNKISPETLIIGNGDIKSYIQGRQMYEKHKVDGIMIGRGIFLNPWVFEKTAKPKLHDKNEYIEVLNKQLNLHNETWGETKNFARMKKFFKMYIKDFAGASLLRQRLMECNDRLQVEKVLNSLQ